MSMPVEVVNLAVVVDDGAATRTIVDDLSFSADAGTIVGLSGPSGSGKTTVLMCLAGVAGFQRGSVRIDDVARRPGDLAGPSELRRLGIVFQDYHLVKTLTVLDNVALPLRIDGRSWSLGRQRARQTLDDLAIGALADAYPGSLSGGEQQRTALARAAVREPTVLLADEPTAHLDQQATELLVDNLRQLAAGGSAVVVSSHDPLVLSQCDAVVRLR